jgi:predicted nucleotidyltransferase
VRGEQRKRSDLDILVDFNNGTLTLFQFVELRDFLSDLLGVKVDLVEKRALKPVIGKHIFEEVVSV